MTERENYITTFRGGKPEWVANYDTAVQYVAPSILEDPLVQMFMLMEENNGEVPVDFEPKDCFGIPWVINDMGPMPSPRKTLLKDINDWREVIRIPDTKNYDWDTACQNDAAFLVPDKVSLIFLSGIFMTLINAMGHEEAFYSLAAEPEETKAFLDAVCTFYEEMFENVLTRMQIDSVIIGDDMASAKNLFISPETYREFFKPLHKRLYDTIKRVSPNTVREFHLCGHGEDILGDLVEIGVESWQPAQQMNNLDEIKRKYPDLILSGVWDNVSILADQNITEEGVRQSVRDIINKYAASGTPFIFWSGGPQGTVPENVQKLEWANDEADKYGHAFLRTENSVSMAL